MSINGLTKDQLQSAADLRALKDIVTSEMARRCYDITVGDSTGGSLEKYSKDPWLYTESDMPQSDELPTKEQANKIIEPTNAVTEVIDVIESNDIMSSLSIIEEKITQWSTTEVTS